MRICLLTHNLKEDNGGGVFSRHLIEGLQKALKAEVVALTAVGSNLPFEQPILYPNKIKLLCALPRARRIIKSCDVVHALDAYPYGIVAALASRGLDKKIILTAVGTGSIKFLSKYRWPITPLVRWSYRKASTVTAISRFMRDSILKRLPNFDIRDITVINPGVDYERFSVVHDQQKHADAETMVHDSLGHSYNVAALPPYMLSVGSLRWRKGYHISIRSFAKVVNNFPNLKYVIVGKIYGQRYYRKMRYHIQRLGLEGKVIILDAVEDNNTLIELYRGAELFCLFPLTEGYDVEGFGIVLLEAAAAGLPIVAARTGGVEDAVHEGENALLVQAKDLSPYNDPHQADPFTDAIENIVRDEELKKRMSAASLAFAKESSWDTRIARYLEIYRRLLNP